ncbi:MAG: SHOCT domain-containing protein [Bacilli bacterium]|jgi:uncharacterized membrane protein|nr:SHOCT domain-containing protein [Bacilli bacterium]
MKSTLSDKRKGKIAVLVIIGLLTIIISLVVIFTEVNASAKSSTYDAGKEITTSVLGGLFIFFGICFILGGIIMALRRITIDDSGVKISATLDLSHKFAFSQIREVAVTDDNVVFALTNGNLFTIKGVGNAQEIVECINNVILPAHETEKKEMLEERRTEKLKATTSSLSEQLQDLKDQYEKGMFTKEEYEEQRKALLKDF